MRFSVHTTELHLSLVFSHAESDPELERFPRRAIPTLEWW